MFLTIFTKASFSLGNARQTTKIVETKKRQKSCSNLIIDFLPILAPIFHNFGSLWGSIWASWGTIWAASSSQWSLLCPLWAHLWAILVPLGSLLATLWPILVPPRSFWTPPKPHFGASGDQFWSPVGCIVGCLLGLFLPPDTCTVGGQISGGTCEALGWA